MEKDNIIFAYELQLKKNESGLYEIVYEKLSERSGNYSNSRYKSIYEVSNGKLIFVNAQNENYSMIEKMTYNLLGKSSFLNIYFFNFNNFNKDTVTDSTRIYVRVCICMVLAFIIKVYLDEEDKHELYFIKKVFSERIKNDNNPLIHLFVFISFPLNNLYTQKSTSNNALFSISKLFFHDAVNFI